ncbi:nucleotidyl transferase AbiEii/AbiGii toxin family protein [Candidatus Micrarchaeota archaeon]|nr:nucleotidyl transferase AbiEii/AbiGii toxin family protein [Candidatus Micrarchaeota archaeon]
MITREELARKARTLGFHLYQAEKDYLQHQLLRAVYSKTTTEFVFKGGTCLQKTMGLDRFSEDLDFTVSADRSPLEWVEHALATVDDFKPRLSRRFTDERSASFKVQLAGPLFNGEAKSMQHLTLELSLREKPLLPAQARRVVPPYDDIRPYTVYALDSAEILSEKIRALLTRDKARDVYDAWFLLRKGVRTDLDSVNKKLKYYDVRFARDEFASAVQSKAKIWRSELGVLMKSPPEFGPIADEVVASVLSLLQNE